MSNVILCWRYNEIWIVCISICNLSKYSKRLNIESIENDRMNFFFVLYILYIFSSIQLSHLKHIILQTFISRIIQTSWVLRKQFSNNTRHFSVHSLQSYFIICLFFALKYFKRLLCILCRSINYLIDWVNSLVIVEMRTFKVFA